jgi:hypothetical protein
MSEYDHCAMILKLESDPTQVFYVECAGNVGVTIARWNSIRWAVGSNKSIDRIVYRKVNLERS